jgi:Fanconi anemia group M protein
MDAAEFDGHAPIAPALDLAGPSVFAPSAPALDPATTHSWIYPLNVPLRTYQHAIVSEALFKNTLVCLPTGLGKTFIAAAVMYNFRRWCPDGLVLFMAPTKPLVAQQIDACRSIVGLAHDDCAELTGKMPRAVRARPTTRR